MTAWNHLWLCCLLGFGTSYLVLAATLRLWRQRWFPRRHTEFHNGQHPDLLSVPRLGGIALAAAYAAVAVLPLNILFGAELSPIRWVIAGASLAMFGLGLWDDLRTLAAKRKLAGQLLIASAAWLSGLEIHKFKIPFNGNIIDLGWWSWPVTVFWLVAMTNLINLIDGVDGLAGGIGLMLMLLVSVVGGTGSVPFVAAGMAGALLAFLRFNFPPARIYLGDGGAYFLGFLIGGLTIQNSHKGTVIAALIAPLFVLALPILDTSLAIVRRGFLGLPLFRPDRQHLHHRLLESGLSRRQLVLGAYVFTAFFLGLGFFAFWKGGQLFALSLGVGTLAVLLVASQFSFSRRWFDLRRMLGNSLGARAEIQYALHHARWLAQEGIRQASIQSICEDTVFIARKLGFAYLHIQLEDGEKTWKMTSPFLQPEASTRQSMQGSGTSRNGQSSKGNEGYAFRHTLPGHPACFIEFQTPEMDARQSSQPLPDDQSQYKIVSDVLAEGWAKALASWQQNQRLPLRFDSGPVNSLPRQSAGGSSYA